MSSRRPIGAIYYREESPQHRRRAVAVVAQACEGVGRFSDVSDRHVAALGRSPVPSTRARPHKNDRRLRSRRLGRHRYAVLKLVRRVSDGWRAHVLAVVSDRLEQVGQVVAVEPVVGVTALAPDRYEVELAKQAQLMRRRALLELHGRSQLVDRPLAVEQLEQDPQPAGGAEGAHRLGEPFGLGRGQRPVGVAVLEGMRHGVEMYL